MYQKNPIIFVFCVLGTVWLGIIYETCMHCTSGFAGVWLQRSFQNRDTGEKGPKYSLWDRNFQLATWCKKQQTQNKQTQNLFFCIFCKF